jgi:alkylation response protein AidB-like acyl-CoA dehydrogenase
MAPFGAAERRQTMAEPVFFILCLIAVFALAMQRASLWLWAAALAAATLIWQTELLHGRFEEPDFTILQLLAWVPVAVLVGLSIPPLRRAALIEPVFRKVKGVLPRVSATEQEALDAGTIGFDAELFSGKPDWEKLRAVPPITLTEEEKAFLDGPTAELCRMVDDWSIRHNQREIPEAIWDFVKKHGFLGMLISKEHGGLGFSAQAQSLVLGKIASRSPDVCTIVMVPNSLGPGELIEKYGTPEQKEHYLPRLAKGLEVPCFSLTGPTSGSDAATMRDVGYVTRGRHEGKEVVGISVSWDKRYITLGPNATLVGLAFRLMDPENILGRGADIGITVALIPADHPGVNIGRRHLPSGSAFPNGPNWGKDVFIPMDWVIGGDKMVGQGWRMLMECLAAGRSISLPSSSAAGAKSLLRNSTAYARVRKQFDLPIGKMEGLEEPLARMVEVAYVNEAARGVTASMVSRGEKPSVISAIMKYQSTERMRRIIDVNVHDRVAVVEPGVINGDLQAAVEAEGLFYAPDPASLGFCSMGGNVAENAGGPRAFKYGVTRDWTLGMTVTLMGGETIKLGRKTPKGVTGYDLTALFVGSEGTFGVTSEITVRLIGKPEAAAALIAVMPDPVTAGRAVSAIIRHGFRPRALELLDRLRECSLVLAEEHHGVMRYRLLETLREYGAEQVGPEERSVWSQRHAHPFCPALQRLMLACQATST